MTAKDRQEERQNDVLEGLIRAAVLAERYKERKRCLGIVRGVVRPVPEEHMDSRYTEIAYRLGYADARSDAASLLEAGAPLPQKTLPTLTEEDRQRIREAPDGEVGPLRFL